MARTARRSARTRSEGLLALVDLNGDNLPDKVFKAGSGISVRWNISGSTEFGPPIAVPTLPAIARESDNGAWVKAATASSSRQGLDRIGVPTASDIAGARAVARLSHGRQDAVGAGVRLAVAVQVTIMQPS